SFVPPIRGAVGIEHAEVCVKGAIFLLQENNVIDRSQVAAESHGRAGGHVLAIDSIRRRSISSSGRGGYDLGAARSRQGVGHLIDVVGDDDLGGVGGSRRQGRRLSFADGRGISRQGDGRRTPGAIDGNCRAYGGSAP